VRASPRRYGQSARVEGKVDLEGYAIVRSARAMSEVETDARLLR
jgi:hypothetical protein